MLRGIPHIAKYMPEAKDARRMLPDPENEPDFERISKVFPLPDERAAMLELALAVRTTGDRIISGTGMPQVQCATNNKWASNYPSMGGGKSMIPSDFSFSVSMPQQRSIAPSFTVASALEAAQAQAAMRVKDAVAAALHLEAELGIHERQNVALVMEFAARRQQANPGITQSVESRWKPPNNLWGYNF
jgi:hypothetical protein